MPRKFAIEAAIHDALYGGAPNKIKDLDLQTKNYLIKQAFQHEALRSSRPAVWIPHDNLGISEHEIRQTKNYSPAIWISDSGAALDRKVGVIFGQNPPDFSEWDTIPL
jgi:calcium permeable stress-gated cation channel